MNIKPSGPSAAWNILVVMRNGLSELGEELGMMEDSSPEMGERVGGLGVVAFIQSERQRDGDGN